MNPYTDEEFRLFLKAINDNFNEIVEALRQPVVIVINNPNTLEDVEAAIKKALGAAA